MYNIVPLTVEPNQNFVCTIPVDAKNITLQFTCRYNTEAEYWFISVSDAQTGQYYIDSVPLITGVYPAADILEQYAYLGIGSATIVKIGSIAGDYPDSTNLGTDFVLVWGDTVE